MVLKTHIQSVIDDLPERNDKKIQQGIRKQILKKIDILQLLHERYHYQTESLYRGD